MLSVTASFALYIVDTAFERRMLTHTACLKIFTLKAVHAERALGITVMKQKKNL